MKKWEFTNLIETKVHCDEPEDWKDMLEGKVCPPGWFVLIDAENMVIGTAPREIARMMVTLFNEVEKTNKWEDPE